MKTRWIGGAALAVLVSAGSAWADEVKVKFVNVPPGVTSLQLAFNAANGSKPPQPMSLIDQVAQAVLNMSKPPDGSPQHLTLHVRRCQKTGQVTATLVGEGGQAPRDCEREGQGTTEDDCDCSTIAILWTGGDIVVDLTAMRQVTQFAVRGQARRFAAALALLSGVSQVLHDEDVCQGGLGELRDAGFNATCNSNNQRFSGGGLLRAQITNLASGGVNASRRHALLAQSAAGANGPSAARWALDLGVEAGFLPLAGKLTLDTAGQNGQFSINTDGFYETRAAFVVVAPQLRFGNRIALVLRGGPAYWRSDSGSSGQFLRGQTLLDQFTNEQENSGVSFMYGGDLLIRLSDKVSIGPSFVAMHQKDGSGDDAVDTRVRQFNAMVRITP